jgi:hypothetical protein
MFIFPPSQPANPATTEDKQMTQYLTVRSGRAFSCDAPGTGYRASVDANGTVRVYDDLAGHYTTVHALTVAQIRYIRRAVAA